MSSAYSYRSTLIQDHPQCEANQEHSVKQDRRREHVLLHWISRLTQGGCTIGHMTAERY